jgi:hypothetical protein
MPPSQRVSEPAKRKRLAPRPKCAPGRVAAGRSLAPRSSAFSSGVVRLTQRQVVRASSGGMGGTALAEVAISTSAARKRLRIVNPTLEPTQPVIASLGAALDDGQRCTAMPPPVPSDPPDRAA